MMEVQPAIVTLSNGIRLVYVPTSSQVSHMGVTILAGSRYEESNEEGLAHFLEHCIFKGTTKRRSLHILSRLDSVGGELNAFTTKEEICVYASFTTEHLKRASELLADIVLHSNFPPKEIQKEKDIVLDEINSYLDSPGDRIFDDFESLIFKNHPLGTNILGTRESVSGFDKDDLLAYTKRFFFAENMVVSFVGDVPIQKLIRRLESDFGSLQHSAKMVLPRGFSGYEPFKIRSKEANFQSHVMVGSIAPGYDNEDRRSMTLLTNILGGASYSPFADTGYWSIYFGTDQKYINKTLKLVYKELKLMREQEITPIQLKKAKEQLKGHLALSFDSNSGLMLGLGKSLLLFNQIDSVQEIYGAIDELKSSDLQEVANRYFNEDGISELIYEQVNE